VRKVPELLMPRLLPPKLLLLEPLPILGLLDWPSILSNCLGVMEELAESDGLDSWKEMSAPKIIIVQQEGIL